MFALCTVAPQSGLSGSDNSVNRHWRCHSNLPLTDPCWYGNENWEISTQIIYNLACTRLEMCQIPSLLARSRWFWKSVNLVLSLKAWNSRLLLPYKLVTERLCTRHGPGAEPCPKSGTSLGERGECRLVPDLAAETESSRCIKKLLLMCCIPVGLSSISLYFLGGIVKIGLQHIQA